MNAPVPRAWFGLAFFFGLAATFVITRTFDQSWTELVPVSLGTRRVLLTLQATVFGLAIQARRALHDARLDGG